MPFDFKRFDAKCANMTTDELQREWEHYTRLISGSATSTAVSGAAIPFTLGVSVIGVGLAAPAIHNARKKREIIERHLQRLGTKHHTRKRDVLTPMAISGTVGLVTLGVGSMGAGAITNAAVEHGITSVAANEIAVKATVHLAVDAVAMTGEEHHMKQKRIAEEHNAWLKQQALAKQNEKSDQGDQGKVDVYDPTKLGDNSYTMMTTRPAGDHKYEYNPAPTLAPLPLYSPAATRWSQDNIYADQSFRRQSAVDSIATSQFIHQQSTGVLEYEVIQPAPQHVRPQPCPVQMGSGQQKLPGHCDSFTESVDAHGGAPPLPLQNSYTLDQTFVAPTLQQPQSTYPQPPVQPPAQLSHPSYPGSMMQKLNYQHDNNLDQVMANLHITPAPPPSPCLSSAGLPGPSPSMRTGAPTSRGYSHESQSVPNASGSYFPPPPQVREDHLTSSQRHASISSLSAPVVQHGYSTPSSHSQSTSGRPSFVYGQGQTSGTTQYGYMTPRLTPGSQYDQGHVQRTGSVSSQYDAQCHVQYQTPGFAGDSYTSGYPPRAPTPICSPPPTPQNYSQYSHSQRHYSQSSYATPPQTQTSTQWQAPHMYNNKYDKAYTTQGYPTPAATPFNPEQNRQSMYFPPPPTQPAKTSAWRS